MVAEKKRKKTWREDASESGCLVGGLAHIKPDGKQKPVEVKFVGKFWHIDQLDRNENDPYFKGVIFDMHNNEKGSVTWNKEEFSSCVRAFTELF